MAGPENIELDPLTALLLWTPTYDEYLASPTLLTIRVSDGDNGVLELNLSITVQPKDEDMDGLPDSYETRTCDENGACLDPTDGTDAESDLDNDGLSNLDEWAAGSDPFQYNGPSTPTLLSPLDGDRINTTSPTLEVEVAPFLSERSSWVKFELYADEALTVLVVDERIEINDSGIIGWQTSELALVEDATYYWRARSESDINETEWSTPFSFIVNAVNEPPPPPVLLNPSDEAVLSERSPTFTATTVVDSDGDDVRYLFRFYRANGDIETLGYGQIDGEVATLTQTLREGVTLSWEVIAVDEVGAQSVGGTQRSFSIDALNKAPGIPEILTPQDGRIHEFNPIEVSLGPNEDSDGHAFEYVVSIYGDESQPILVGSVDAEDDGSATYTAETRLEEDRGYNVVVYAEDEFGARSESTIHRFFLSSENDPPSRPELLGPTNLAPLTTSQTVLTWAPSTDPEGAMVTYRVTACTEDPTTLETYDDCFVKERIQPNGFDFRSESVPGVTYFWFVEAVDDTGLSSEPSSVWQFKVVVTETGDDGCDCQQFRSGPISAWLIFLCFAFVLTYRRRCNDH